MAMDESLWGQLPPELLLRVLAFLPLCCLFRFRCVCKDWRDLIYSADFRKISVEAESAYANPYPAVCYLKQGQGLRHVVGFRWFVYDRLARNWQRMPSLPLHLIASSYASEFNYGGAGGLLFTWRWNQFRQVFTIGNPLTKEWRELPPMINYWSQSAVRRVLIDETTKTYKVIMAGNRRYGTEDERYQVTEVYDSALGAWKEGGMFLPYESVTHPRGAVCKGVLYFLVKLEARSGNLTIVLLIAYNIEYDVWSEIPHVFPTDLFCCPQLVEYEDRLLMMVTYQDTLDAPSFFELNFKTNEWVFVFQMPVEIYKLFARIRGCVASRSQLCVAGRAACGELLVVVCDMCQCTWWRLPPCPLTLSSSSFEEMCVPFSFEPSLRSIY